MPRRWSCGIVSLRGWRSSGFGSRLGRWIARRRCFFPARIGSEFFGRRRFLRGRRRVERRGFTFSRGGRFAFRCRRWCSFRCRRLSGKRVVRDFGTAADQKQTDGSRQQAAIDQGYYRTPLPIQRTPAAKCPDHSIFSPSASPCQISSESTYSNDSQGLVSAGELIFVVPLASPNEAPPLAQPTHGPRDILLTWSLPSSYRRRLPMSVLQALRRRRRDIPHQVWGTELRRFDLPS